MNQIGIVIIDILFLSVCILIWMIGRVSIKIRRSYEDGYKACMHKHNIVDADEFEEKIKEGLKHPAVMTPTPKMKETERLIREYCNKKGIK